MYLINRTLNFIVTLLDRFLPVLGIPDSFFIMLDGAIDFLITLLQGASFLLPLDVMVSCFAVITLVDNFATMSRIGQFILKMIRG